MAEMARAEPFVQVACRAGDTSHQGSHSRVIQSSIGGVLEWSVVRLLSTSLPGLTDLQVVKDLLRRDLDHGQLFNVLIGKSAEPDLRNGGRRGIRDVHHCDPPRRWRNEGALEKTACPRHPRTGADDPNQSRLQSTFFWRQLAGLLENPHPKPRRPATRATDRLDRMLSYTGTS